MEPISNQMTEIETEIDTKRMPPKQRRVRRKLTLPAQITPATPDQPQEKDTTTVSKEKVTMIECSPTGELPAIEKTSVPEEPAAAAAAATVDEEVIEKEPVEKPSSVKETAAKQSTVDESSVEEPAIDEEPSVNDPSVEEPSVEEPCIEPPSDKSALEGPSVELPSVEEPSMDDEMGDTYSSKEVIMLCYINAKQKHPGCKKSARPIRSSIANRYVCATKNFDIS